MCVCFLTTQLFTVMNCQHLAQLSKLEDHPLSAVGACLFIYSQLFSIFEAVPPSTTRGNALRWAGYVACMVEGEFHTGFWGGHLREEDHLGTQGWMGLQEVGCWGMDWIGLVQVKDSWREIVNAVMNHWVPLNAGKFLTS